MLIGVKMDNMAERKSVNIGVTVMFRPEVLAWLDGNALEGHRSRNAQVRLLVEREFKADKRVEGWLADAAAEG